MIGQNGTTHFKQKKSAQS